MLRTTIVALILALGPVAAQALCPADHSREAASCPAGSVWSAEKGACVEVTG